ncbi:hypothetical protein RDI61_14175 [Pseudomonas plecoglossicida]|uniref:hypothetical protein n=1 Tax=Pseudomonas TaxID=286 RepID=UPI000761AEF2|nr:MULTISPECIES: hypothetical protein [Pseudomonas]MDQ7965181.1 hypothetical protein [Pseudomonas plecoglossicida]WBM44590.1 hypothetical protein M2J85_17790 [Pseudomonas putida]WFG01014.1 hypothetical protein P3X84_17975 [Pseudomonas putida]
MSDAKQNAFNTSQYLNTTTGKRAVAVSAALELIAARASSPAAVHLEEEFNNLSKYADQIEAALNKR